ncbi:MAG: hypothetical protein ACTS1Z_14410 [Parasphingopyxis sp.]|uniref:hypothetical protein n=1 Tax=Parasphingopyxis sp. TaxID=1920299 RepID=UPI003FA11C13
MDKERLARAIAKIEQAADAIGKARNSVQPDTTSNAQLEADLESARSALEDRDRTIAKLRADADDIGRLKDEEIARLRDRLEAGNTAENGVSVAEYQELQQKYAQLKASAEATLAGLDQVIGKAERANHG